MAYIVVPFQTTDEIGQWEPTRAAILESDSVDQGIDEFILSCVHPHADKSVWGDAADKGSSPERDDDHFYIAFADDEDEETAVVHLSIHRDRVKSFEDEEDAETYRDREFRTWEWAYDNRSIDDD